MKTVISFSVVIVSVFAMLVGCSSEQAADGDVQAQRDRYLLSEEPEGAIGVVEVRESETELKEVVLYGRVKERVDGQAAFWINDPTADIHHDHGGEGHDAENCAFCKSQKENAVNPTAVVQLVDDANQPISGDSKELLGVEAGQMVVVKGQANLDETLDVLTINVSRDGVYIRE